MEYSDPEEDFIDASEEERERTALVKNVLLSWVDDVPVSLS